MRLRTIATIIALYAALTAFFVFIAVVWGTLAGQIAFLAILLCMSVYMAATVFSVHSGAPFVPMDDRSVAEMLRLAGLRPGDRLGDLGSGDGRVLIAAAKAGAVAEGWEINPILWLCSLWNARRAGVADRVRIHLSSYWDKPLRDKTVVTLYLITGKMARMERKLLAELPAGARVVSYTFRFPDWAPSGASGPKLSLYVKSVKDS